MVSFLVHIWLVYVSFIPIFNANPNEKSDISAAHDVARWRRSMHPKAWEAEGKPMGMKCSHQVEGWQAGWFSKLSGSLDWKNLGKILTGNHGFYHSIWGCSVNFPVNQSNDWGISVDIHDYDHPNRFLGWLRLIFSDFWQIYPYLMK